VGYVQGFIDGAVATDERVTRNVAAKYERKETYTERAIRTRSRRHAPARISRYGATVYSGICPGAPVPLQELVEHVSNDLMNRKVLRRTTSRATPYMRCCAAQRIPLRDGR